MSEDIKKHQKMGQKDPSVLLPIEKINLFERYMNYVDPYKDLMEYFRLN